jgi:hypothetical protein
VKCRVAWCSKLRRVVELAQEVEYPEDELTQVLERLVGAGIPRDDRETWGKFSPEFRDASRKFAGHLEIQSTRLVMAGPAHLRRGADLKPTDLLNQFAVVSDRRE